MAERIDDIISPKAFEQVKQMNADITTLVKNFESSASAAKLINAALSGSNSMQAVTQNVKAAAAEVAKLEAAQKRLEFANSEAGAELASLNYQISEANRLNRALAKEMSSAEGSSSQLQGQLIRLRAQFDSMSASLRQSPLGQELAKRINMVDTALKTLDSNTGRFQRNVGNYATATNSLSQVLREMPAFTYSAQTGILGISNNLPILIDQFRAVKAETGSASQAFKIFAGSLLSFTNIFTIAIGLFTIFSKEIFAFFESTEKATDGQKEMSEAIKEMNEEREKMIAQIAKERAELTVLYDTATNTTASYYDRGKAVDMLIEKYPEWFEVTEREKLLNGQLTSTYDALTESINKRALATAQQSKLTKLFDELGALQLRLNELTTGSNKDTFVYSREDIENLKAQISLKEKDIEQLKKSMNLAKSFNDQEIFFIDEKTRKEYEAKQKQLKNEAILGKEEIERRKKEAERRRKQLEKEQKEKEKEDKKEAKPVIDIPDKLNEKEIEDLKQYFEDIKKHQEKYLKQYFSDPVIIAQLQKEIDETMNTPEDLPDVQAAKLAEELKTHYAKKEAETRKKITKEEQREKTKITIENTAKLVNMAAEIMSIAADIQFQKEMAMIDERTKALEASYDEEIKRLERSGMSKEKIEKEKQRLEAQTEAQRKNIDKQRIAAQQRKARSDKAADIANIITGTAVAIVNQLAAKPVGPWNIALAAGMAAIGAANLARAVATPLPQFAKGTSSAPGGLAEVGEKGTELIIEPSGHKYLTPNKSTIMNVKKGSRIVPHHELMNQVRLAAMVKLSGKDSVSESDYGNALIQAVIEQTEEQKRTRRAMERMNTTVIVNDNSSFQKWVTTYCK